MKKTKTKKNWKEKLKENKALIFALLICAIFSLLFFNYKTICDYFGYDYSTGLVWIFVGEMKKLFGL